MKKKCKNIWRIWGISCIVVILFSIVMDYVYKGLIERECIVDVYERLANIPKWMGLKYCKALEILNGVLGVLFTTFSLILNMGLNIANRSEHKIFGIPRKELEELRGERKVSLLRNIIYVFPLLMILCMNLGLCITGYVVLIFSYVFLIINYSLLGKSYDKEEKQQLVINGLLFFVEDKKYKQEDNLIRYQAMIEEIRKGILKEEGWRNGELLYKGFLGSIEQYDYFSKYILTYHFFDCLFYKGKERNYVEELKCVCEFVNRNEDEHLKRGQFDINDYSSLLGVFNAIILRWDEYELINFLKWYFDYKSRSIYKNKLLYGDVDSGEQERAGILLVFVEYWLWTNEKNVILNEKILEVLWEYGKNFLKREEKLLEIIAKLISVDGRKGQDILQKCIENLREDSNKNRQRSLICHIINNFN